MTVQPTPENPTPVLVFPGARTKEQAFVERQMENLTAALVMAHGAEKARIMFAEAAIAVAARQARAGNSLVATRYVCEIALERCFVTEQRQVPGDTTDALRQAADQFLYWMAPKIAHDEKPEVSAREFCRELLSRVGSAVRTMQKGGAV